MHASSEHEAPSLSNRFNRVQTFEFSFKLTNCACDCEQAVEMTKATVGNKKRRSERTTWLFDLIGCSPANEMKVNRSAHNFFLKLLLRAERQPSTRICIFKNFFEYWRQDFRCFKERWFKFSRYIPSLLCGGAIDKNKRRKYSLMKNKVQGLFEMTIFRSPGFESFFRSSPAA